MFAVLGDIEFEVRGGITGLDLRSTADWAEHALIQGKPLLEWIGEGLDEYSLSIRLHAAIGDPEARLRKLREAKTKHEPMAFVLGSGDYLGVFVITDLSNSVQRTMADGRLLIATLQVTLREYTGKVTRRAVRAGLLSPSIAGTRAAMLNSPKLVLSALVEASPIQRVLGQARTVSNLLRSAQGLYDLARSGSPVMALGQVPQLLNATARMVGPLQSMGTAAALLNDGSDLVALSSDVLGSVAGARSSLSPVDLASVVERVGTSADYMEQAVTRLGGASTRLAGLAAQIVTRRA